jgi:hypothetical protein
MTCDISTAGDVGNEFGVGSPDCSWLKSIKGGDGIADLFHFKSESHESVEKNVRRRLIGEER